MEPISKPDPVISLLIVEDEQDTLDILSSILAKKYPDIPIYSADNGVIGLELFKTHTPDIVITDLNMPVMDGMQLAFNICNIKRDTRFIFLTGDSEKISQQHSEIKLCESENIIIKPVALGALFAAVERCLGEINDQGKE